MLHTTIPFSLQFETYKLQIETNKLHTRILKLNLVVVKSEWKSKVQNGIVKFFWDVETTK